MIESSGTNRYAVFWQYGSCVYQDHDCDYEWFDTLEEAEGKVAEVLKADSDANWAIVRSDWARES